MTQPKRSFTEQLEVSGDELVTTIKKLYDDASAKRVVIKDSKGSELLSVPLTVGAGAGVVALVAAPALAAVAAIGGLVARVRLEVERVDDRNDPEPIDPQV